MSSDNEARDERSPLLRPRPDVGPILDTPRRQKATANRLLVIILCIILSIVLGTANTAVDTALLQVQEDILCDKLHQLNTPRDDGLGDPNDASRHCEDREVQAQLSIIRSWAIIFDLVPGLVMAIPFGLVADKQGRTLVLGLSILGTAASTAFQILVCAFPAVFPLRLVWLGSAFNFIGGGETVFDAMLHTILADISDEAQRATTFFYLGAALTLGTIAGGPITYWLMIRGAWLSLFLALGCLAFCVIIGFCMPETLDRRDANMHEPRLEEEAENPKSNTMLTGLRLAMKRFGDFTYVLATKERKVGFLFLSLLLSNFGRGSQMLLQQYVKARFKWSWGEAGLVDTIQSFCSLILLSIALPLLTQVLLRILPPRQKDMWLARASILLQTIGSFEIGLAGPPLLLIGGVVISALGFGFNLIVRAMIASLISHDIATLFSFVAFFETAMVAAANPLLSAAFRAGLKWGGYWLGLPFFVSGFLFMGALIIVACVSVSDGDIEPGDGETSETSETS